MRLTNRQKQIPNGYQFYDPVLKWRPLKWCSFDVICSGLRSARLANPGVTRANNLPTDPEAIANEVEAYNVAICQQMGYLDYITDAPGGAPQAVPFPPPGFPRDHRTPPVRRSATLQSARNVVAGSEVLVEWVASGAEAVPQEQANHRAETCARCPLNVAGDWTAIFTVPVSNAIRAALSAKGVMKLATPFDDRLGVCMACDCPMALKVWVPFEKFFGKMSQATKDALNRENPTCWILEEMPK